MKIAIVDDDKIDRSEIENIVSKYFLNKDINLGISLFVSGEDFLKEYKKDEYDIIFLDIYMYEKNGIDIATHIRKSEDNCKIVFLTSSSDFAVMSYEVDALYYVLKPAKIEKIWKILDKCMQIPIEKTVEVLSERVVVEIPLSKILWLETFRNLLIIHLHDQEVRTYMTLQKFIEDTNSDGRFLVSCKGCIVNMDYVIDINEFDFILINGAKVQIRKRGAASVKMEYFRYKCKKMV